MDTEPSAREDHADLPPRTTEYWWLPLLIGTALIAVVATAVGAARSKLWAVAPAALVLGSIFPIAVGLYYRRLTDRTLIGFRQGGYLVRWEYDPARWAAHLDDRLALERSETRRKSLWVGMIFGVGVAAVLIAAGPAGPISWVVGVAALAGTIGVAQAVGSWNAVRRYRLARAGRPVPAYIGVNCLYCSGHVWFWGDSTSLERLELLAEPPPSLRFEFSTRATYDNIVTTRILIPVPVGREDEAREVCRIYTDPSYPISSSPLHKALSTRLARHLPLDE